MFRVERFRGFRGSRFKVQGFRRLGLRDLGGLWGLGGLGVWGLGLRDLGGLGGFRGLGFRGLGFRVQGFRRLGLRDLGIGSCQLLPFRSRLTSKAASREAFNPETSAYSKPYGNSKSNSW